MNVFRLYLELLEYVSTLTQSKVFSRKQLKVFHFITVCPVSRVSKVLNSKLNKLLFCYIISFKTRV